MGKSWKDVPRRQLEKVVYALTEDRLKPLIVHHENRGWVQVSEIKPYNRGVGCLMVCSQ